MEAFRMDGDDNRLYFRNSERISDDEEYEQVMSYLSEAGCEIGEPKMAPDCDLIECKYDGDPFTVIRTIDGDGSFIYAENREVLDNLEQIFL